MITTVLTALITASGVLLATWLSNKHNRGLKILELREQTALTIRQEKREAYLELLRAHKMAVQYTIQLGYMGLSEQLQTDPEAIEAASQKFRELTPELELVGSREVYDLAQELYRGLERCNYTMYQESEKRFAEFDCAGKEASQEQKEAIWQEVRAEIQKVHEELGMETLYGQLRNQIREELGFLALDPNLVPTSEETERLRRELSTLDQIR